MGIESRQVSIQMYISCDYTYLDLVFKGKIGHFGGFLGGGEALGCEAKCFCAVLGVFCKRTGDFRLFQVLLRTECLEV